MQLVTAEMIFFLEFVIMRGNVRNDLCGAARSWVFLFVRLC